MFFKELKGHEQSSRSNLEPHKDEILFLEHESSAIQKVPKVTLMNLQIHHPLCASEVQQVLHPF